jgi:hypothetical protein
MSNERYNLIEHNEGGNKSPYEEYHLTADTKYEALREASQYWSGLVPAKAAGLLEWVNPPPATSYSAGKKGQRAVDANYYYICVKDGYWKRFPLETFGV